MKNILTLFTLLTLTLSLAQPAQMREMFEKHRPVFDLMATVGLMTEVEKQKGLVFSKAQAGRLMPLLKNLHSSAALSVAEAEKLLGTIEDDILSAGQLAWMDKTRLERGEQTRRQSQQGQGMRFGPPGGFGGQGQPPVFLQAMIQGKPFNPFKEGQARASLEAAIAVLQAK